MGYHRMILWSAPRILVSTKATTSWRPLDCSAGAPNGFRFWNTTHSSPKSPNSSKREPLRLCREFLRQGVRNPKASWQIASVEPSLVRILNRLLGVPLQIIGPAISRYGQFNGETVPILIDTVECLRAVTEQSSRRWKFYAEDLVLDLTDAAFDARPHLSAAHI